MINKENEYNKGIFDIMKEDFEQTTDDKIVLSLIKELFLTDANDINNEDVVKNLLKEEDKKEDVVINLKPDGFEQDIGVEASSRPLKKLLFTEVDYINNDDTAEKTPKDE